MGMVAIKTKPMFLPENRFQGLVALRLFVENQVQGQEEETAL